MTPVAGIERPLGKGRHQFRCLGLRHPPESWMEQVGYCKMLGNAVVTPLFTVGVGNVCFPLLEPGVRGKVKLSDVWLRQI